MAPGGGAVAHNQGEEYRKKNEDLLLYLGKLVYLLPSENLEESARILDERKLKDPRTVDLRINLGATLDVLKTRHPTYARLADITVITGTKTIQEIVEELYSKFKSK